MYSLKEWAEHASLNPSARRSLGPGVLHFVLAASSSNRSVI